MRQVFGRYKLGLEEVYFNEKSLRMKIVKKGLVRKDKVYNFGVEDIIDIKNKLEWEQCLLSFKYQNYGKKFILDYRKDEK